MCHYKNNVRSTSFKPSKFQSFKFTNFQTLKVALIDAPRKPEHQWIDRAGVPDSVAGRGPEHGVPDALFECVSGLENEIGKSYLKANACAADSF